MRNQKIPLRLMPGLALKVGVDRVGGEFNGRP
jgi:hypothetical protein